jgi:hypothetical protein
MYRRLQVNAGKVFNAQNTVKVDMSRGTFVKEEYDAVNKITKLVKATSGSDYLGILTRDVVVDLDVAIGLPVSDYSDSQDIVKAGEYAGVETIQRGERYATESYDSALLDADVVEGSPLTIVNGQLAKGTTGSAFYSIGWVNDAGHKLLGFRLA